MDGPLPLFVPRVGSSKCLQHHAAHGWLAVQKRTSSTDAQLNPFPLPLPAIGRRGQSGRGLPRHPSSHNGTPLSNDSVELRDETQSEEERGGCPEGTQSESWVHKMRRSLSLSACGKGEPVLPLTIAGSQGKKRGTEQNMFVVPFLSWSQTPIFPRVESGAARPMIKYRDGTYLELANMGQNKSRTRI
jgi:hypothetical protein